MVKQANSVFSLSSSSLLSLCLCGEPLPASSPSPLQNLKVSENFQGYKPAHDSLSSTNHVKTIIIDGLKGNFMVGEALEVQLGPLLRQNGLKLAAAESCTGGLIGHRVTNVPGSSDYYLGSIIAYSYEAKERLLGVKHATLLAYGAVSQETVIEMAHGVRTVFSPDFPMEKIIGISVSGIAGPGGGMPGKPVGLVWIGLSAAGLEKGYRFLWDGDRLKNKELSAEMALQLLLDYLQGGQKGHASS